MKILAVKDLCVRQRTQLESGEGNYMFPVVMPSGGIACVARLLFTHAILADLNDWGYEDRWCFHTKEIALAALMAWDGEDGTEPQGWHRHPGSGRRREHGLAALETIDP